MDLSERSLPPIPGQRAQEPIQKEVPVTREHGISPRIKEALIGMNELSLLKPEQQAKLFRKSTVVMAAKLIRELTPAKGQEIRTQQDEIQEISSLKIKDEALLSKQERSRKIKLLFFVTCLVACVAYAVISGKINPFTKEFTANLMAASASTLGILYYCKRRQARPRNAEESLAAFQKNPQYRFFEKAFLHTYNLTESRKEQLLNDRNFKFKLLEFYGKINEVLTTNFPDSIGKRIHTERLLNDATELENDLVRDYDLRPRTALHSEFVTALAIPTGNRENEEELGKAFQEIQPKKIDTKFTDLIAAEKNMSQNKAYNLVKYLFIASLVALVVAHIFLPQAERYLLGSSALLLTASSVGKTNALISKNKFKKQFKEIRKDPFYQEVLNRFSEHFKMDDKTSLEMARDYKFFKLVNALGEMQDTEKSNHVRLGKFNAAKELSEAVRTKYDLELPAQLEPDPILSHLVKKEKPIWSL